MLFTLLREKKDGDRIALQPGDHDFAHLLLVNRGRRAGARAARARRSGGPADERRHHRHAERRARHARRLRHRRACRCRRGTRSALSGARQTSSCCRCRCSTSTRNVGVQALAFVDRQPDRARAEPARPRRSARDDPARQADVLQRRADALHRAAQPSATCSAARSTSSRSSICFSGAAPLLADTKTRFEALTGGRIVEGYSLTEAMMALLRQPGEGRRTSSARSACRCPTCTSASSTPTKARGSCRADEVGEIAIAAPQLMAGYWNQPDETASVLRDHVDGRRHAAVAAHRRPRLPRRGRLPLHRRSQEGPDQDERLPGVAARDRRSARGASGGRRSRRRRRPRRDQRRSRQGVGRAARRADGDRSGAARVLPREARAVQSAGARSSSAPSCRRRWSARCCGGRCREGG